MTNSVQHPRLDAVEEAPSQLPEHLALVIPSLTAGGAERVAARMANHWAGERRRITVFTFDDGSEPPFYELINAVDHRPLDVADVSTTLWEQVTNNVRRVFRLRSALNRVEPDVVIAFMPAANVLSVVAGIVTRWPVIVCEQDYPGLYSLKWIWRVLQQLTYPLADAFVGVSQQIVQYFSSIVRKEKVIHNPVVPAKKEIGETPSSKERAPVICAMGRLVHQKGFDLLLRAFGKIEGEHPDWTLEIWGEGEQREELKNLRSQLGITDRVRLPGLTDEPFEKMKRAAFFVLSSRHEGFVNVVGEALACGLPVISFDCPTGPSEIIRPGIDGELVPPEDVTALAEAMHAMIENPDRRRRYGEQALEVRDRLGTDAVMQDWNRLVAEVWSA
ncbi:glycosyltransferase family 4 protein [Salinibacter ruber]|uniref:glycosyltransferase family 4 protein n=1 Tax=Salinibacter ruber TaxID=146919 RepID=UPI0020744F8E|nr:glycosyltransferase family 4 protein [Salinibacter ruber]